MHPQEAHVLDLSSVSDLSLKRSGSEPPRKSHGESLNADPDPNTHLNVKKNGVDSTQEEDRSVRTDRCKGDGNVKRDSSEDVKQKKSKKTEKERLTKRQRKEKKEKKVDVPDNVIPHNPHSSTWPTEHEY